ncbi:hypothetical protein HU200_060700 [Digitaria exilis]|uniref:F-box domain-containing protein n=1 Tax=Digitaria exilis TaxID=1010633 RepID=A0A835A8X0_9POAL|nr:hypothetical protein HU200_060700 [Digitaria exilis]
MANQNPSAFVHVDARAAAGAMSRGQDPHALDRGTSAVLYYLYTSLPDLPVSADARLSALPASPSAKGTDRISALPSTVLREIVSRLPIKDAARTSVLSKRWLPVWLSAPVAIDDTTLRPRALVGRAPVRADSPVLAAAVTRILAAHPGPFRAVYLVRSYMDGHQQQLAHWLRLLAAKGVDELVLVNRPWPIDMPLPATILNITTLTRLFIGVWKFPDTAGLPRGGCGGGAALFPHLRELIVCCVSMENRDMDFLLAGSPVLETLGIQGYKKVALCLRLVGQRLQCVQICLSVVETITVVDAPLLERLILWEPLDDSCVRLKIDRAPKLRLLGYLEPGTYTLEMRNTVINKTVEATGKLNLKFWQENGPIESMQSHIKLMSFREFRGDRSELDFLKFFMKNARVLEKVEIMSASGCFTSVHELQSKVAALDPDNWASDDCSLAVYIGSEGSDIWNFRRGLDVSVDDPFARY